MRAGFWSTALFVPFVPQSASFCPPGWWGELPLLSSPLPAGWHGGWGRGAVGPESPAACFHVQHPILGFSQSCTGGRRGGDHTLKLAEESPPGGREGDEKGARLAGGILLLFPGKILPLSSVVGMEVPTNLFWGPRISSPHPAP